MSVKMYATFELLIDVRDTDLGDVVEIQEAPRGTALSQLRKQPRLTFSETPKRCLANLVPGLAESTVIVHIPDVDRNGKKLDREQWMQGFWWACDKWGVPTWTQSSIKNLTFYFIPRDVFDKAASKWDVSKDGPRFASYWPLVFSEMTETLTLDGEVVRHFPLNTLEIPEVVKPLLGEDGNCAWPFDTAQFRGMVQDPVDGYPTAIDKGIGVHVAGVNHMEMNTTQVKFGGAGNHVIMRNAALTSAPIKIWISAEPLILLHDTPKVRAFVAGRVRRVVGRLLDLLSEEGRVDMLKRWRGLRIGNDGELMAALRAVIEALRSNTPLCLEIEERIARFMIREIAEHIVPSCGVEGRASLLVINDEHGQAPCTWDKAKVFVCRIPATGSNAIIPMKKSPYKKGQGMVVTSEVAKLASGDGDGDLLICVDDKEAVDLFRECLNHEIVSGLKPEKVKANEPLTPLFLEDAAIRQVSNNWMVGALTVAGWKMIQAKRFDVASEMLDLANVEPMTYKHSVTYGGLPFAQYAMTKYGEIKDDAKEISLQWRDKGIEAKGWKSIRTLATAMIDEPASHLDIAWNAAVDAAIAWTMRNVRKPLSLSDIAHKALGKRGIVPTAADKRAALELRSDWNDYWKGAKESGTLKSGDHSRIFAKVAKWGREAPIGALAELMLYRSPNPESSGFSLKWHAIYAAGRACDLIGLHPMVAEALQAMRGKDNAKRGDDLVEKVVDLIL